MSDVRRYQPVGRGETVPDKYGRYCKYEDVEHWIGMYNLCNEREQSLLAERDKLREALHHALKGDLDPEDRVIIDQILDGAALQENSND